MIKQIQVQFDLNQPFAGIAQSVNPALPGMPIEPAGWTNVGPFCMGIDAQGNVYMWTVANDVDPSGVVTLRPLTNSLYANYLRWISLQNGPSAFPQPPAPAAPALTVVPPAGTPAAEPTADNTFGFQTGK